MKKPLFVLSNIILYLPNCFLSGYFLLIFALSVLEYVSSYFAWPRPCLPINVFEGILGLILAVCTIVGMRSSKLSSKVKLAWASFVLSMILLLFFIITALVSDGLSGIVRHGGFNAQIIVALLSAEGTFAITLVCVLIARALRQASHKTDSNMEHMAADVSTTQENSQTTMFQGSVAGSKTKEILPFLSNIVLYLPNIVVSGFLLLHLILSIFGYVYPDPYLYIPSGILGLILMVCIVVGMSSSKLSRKVKLAWASVVLSMILLLLTFIVGKPPMVALLIAGTFFSVTLICVLAAKALRQADPHLKKIY